MGVRLDFLKPYNLKNKTVNLVSTSLKPLRSTAQCPIPDSTPRDKTLLLHYLIFSKYLLVAVQQSLIKIQNFVDYA